MTRGTPEELGFVRPLDADKINRLISDQSREVWQSPQGVLLALPKACQLIGLLEVSSPSRGTTLVCVEPAGVFSVWPCRKKGVKIDGETGED